MKKQFKVLEIDNQEGNFVRTNNFMKAIDLKDGDILFDYDVIEDCIRKLTVHKDEINEGFLYLESKYDSMRLSFREIDEYLKSNDYSLAIRENKLDLINLVHATQVKEALDGIQSSESMISDLRKDIENLNKWRKRQIGTTKVSKKAKTINLSSGIITIHQ